MATLTVVTSSLTAATLAPASITSGGDVMPNNGRTILQFVNQGTVGAVTVTAVTAGTVLGLAIADVTISVPKTTYNPTTCGPFDPNVFNNSAGQVALTYAGNAGDITATTVLAISI